MTERLLTLHPKGLNGVNIEVAKYNQIKDAMLRAFSQAEMIRFKDLSNAVESNLTEPFDGSMGWYTTSVKLDLEARNIIERIPKKSPMQIRMTPIIDNVKLAPTNKDRLIILATFANFSAETLFKHLSTPELLTHWWPQEATIDAQKDGAYTFSWPEMGMTLTGTITEIEPPSRLTYTWNWTHQPEMPERTVQIDIAEAGTGCHLRLLMTSYTEAETDIEDRQNHIDGWLHFLGQLQNIAKQ